MPSLVEMTVLLAAGVAEGEVVMDGAATSAGVSVLVGIARAGVVVDAGAVAVATAGWQAERKRRANGMIFFIMVGSIFSIFYCTSCMALRAWSSKKLGLMESAFCQALSAPALSPFR